MHMHEAHSYMSMYMFQVHWFKSPCCDLQNEKGVAIRHVRAPADATQDSVGLSSSLANWMSS